jgi:ABC-type branched-subunit amino acid transport system substrate-binding protein
MPNVSKVSPSRTDLLRHTGRYAAQRHGRDQLILLRPDIHADKEAQEQMARALTEALAQVPGRLRDTALVARPGRRDLGDLPAKLSADRLNVLLAPSDDVEYVTNLVAKLKPLAAKHRIVLIGLESWQNMETVASADLDLLGFLFATATFTDHDDPLVQAFTRRFRERYHNDVDEYALLGFDVTLRYGLALMEHGAALADGIAQVHTRPLHLGFRMVRSGPENGWRNEHAVMLQQKDFRLSKAP